MSRSIKLFAACMAVSLMLAMGLSGCAQTKASTTTQAQSENAHSEMAVNDKAYSESTSTTEANTSSMKSLASASEERTSNSSSSGFETTQSASEASMDAPSNSSTSLETARAALNMIEDYRSSFDHGPKGAEFQKYIVLHDTEGESSPMNTVNYWDSSGNGVAAHFVVGKDGSIVQCVPLDRITHHAGFGDTGHNGLYGVEDESRDDKLGTTSIGSWAADYGMNSYSIGIEMVHVGGTGYYPEEQLQAVDNLIAYIDAYYGFQSAIIDHKVWRSGNSDTSPEFAAYLANYQNHRTHL